MEKDYEKIRLEDKKGLFSYPESEVFLHNTGINTIGELMHDYFKIPGKSKIDKYPWIGDIYKAKDFINCIYKGICVFKNIEEMDSIIEIGRELGFNEKTIYSLQKKYGVKQFISIVRGEREEVEKTLKTEAELNQVSIEEIIFKTSAVLDYYRRQRGIDFTFNICKNERDFLTIYSKRDQDSRKIKELMDIIEGLLKEYGEVCGNKTKNASSYIEYAELIRIKKEFSDMLSEITDEINKMTLVICKEEYLDSAAFDSIVLSGEVRQEKAKKLASRIMNISRKKNKSGIIEGKKPYVKE